MIEGKKGYRFLMDAPQVLHWLSFLQTRGLVHDEDLADISRDILVIKTREKKEAPLYLRALSAVGAVISGLLLIYLLYLFGLFDLSDTSLSINGLIFIGLSALLHARGLRRTNLARDFYIQLALTWLQAGKVALVAGLAQIVHDAFGISWFWTVSAILGLVMLLSFLSFPSSIERFVSSFAFLVSLWICLLVDWSDEFELTGFVLMLIAHILALASFLRWPLVRQKLTSLYDALLLSLCLAVGVIQGFVSIGHEAWQDVSEEVKAFLGIGYRWSVEITLALALIALIVWIAGRKGGLRREPVVASLLGAVALALLSNAGIILAIGLMILGFATHRPGHTLLGLLFALLFGFFYYYNLDLSLLQKSMILIVSGALLLLASGYIYWRGWYRQTGKARGAGT
ncbi:DUF4401 domain-containing protein [uncultured Cohaesibacter sp.]|uniref:DUF4401 domain-containing protein n=1 Tax=uncultured Cohaesibacter sp. TaxID=1002546 RepID=UPI002AAC18B2|nr:DUF4401 domain-containing protein [uncultured Cohaesibacter sp.]